MNALRFCLNGEWIEERAVAPTTTLLRYLRDTLRLTGTKEGCAEGDCGACTVAVAEADPDGAPSWRAVNACLLLLPMVQGKQVVTVEALREKGTGAYHPAQEAMARALGSQCGYCTPGIVMSLFEATYRADLDAPWKLDDQLCGNLCRCTGYRPIREAAQQVAGRAPADRFAGLLQRPSGMALDYAAQGQRFFTPSSRAELFALLAQHPSARVVVGGTDLSLEITKRYAKPPLLVSLEGVEDFKALTQTASGFRLGATATVAELEAFCAQRLPPVHRMVRYFGARQIKHRGTLGGNLCTASPIGDLPPVLICLGAQAVLASAAGERRLALEDFFVGYRKTALLPGEVLAAVEVPRLPARAHAAAYKVSKRRELDISAVSAGLYVETDAANTVTVARLAFGGLAATVKRAATVERHLVGQPWSEASVAAAASHLGDDFTPQSDHRGGATYRRLVARNLLIGFALEVPVPGTPALRERHSATVQAEGAALG